MNKIPVAGELYNIKWSVKIPFTPYWIVYLNEIKLLDVVTKYFDDKGYYYNKIGLIKRPEKYLL